MTWPEHQTSPRTGRVVEAAPGRPCFGRDRRRASPCGSGFTLVELLVVLGVLSILASLLLPALVGARNGARSAGCASNLRQFDFAAQLYWDDHEGAAFRYRVGVTNGGDLYWFGWLERGAEGARRFDPVPGALWPYLAGRGVEVCPALDTRAPGFKPKAMGGACGYGYSLALAAPLDQPPIRIAALARPCEAAVFADAAQVNDFQAPASPEHPLLEEFYYLDRLEPTVHFRHVDRCNVAFVDGHVARRRSVPGSYDARLPRARVGRLPEEVFRVP